MFRVVIIQSFAIIRLRGHPKGAEGMVGSIFSFPGGSLLRSLFNGGSPGFSLALQLSRVITIVRDRSKAVFLLTHRFKISGAHVADGESHRSAVQFSLEYERFRLNGAADL